VYSVPTVQAATADFGSYEYVGDVYVGTLSMPETGIIYHVNAEIGVNTAPLAVGWVIGFDGEVIASGTVSGSTTIYASVDVSTMSSSGEAHTISFWIDPTYGGIVEDSQTASISYTPVYYLTVETGYGSAGGYGYYASGTTTWAGLSTGEVSISTGTKAVFSHWSISGVSWGSNYAQSLGILMDSNKTIVANWDIYHQLTVTGGNSGTIGYNNGAWIEEGTTATSYTSYVYNTVTEQSRTNVYRYNVDGASWVNIERAYSGNALASLTMDAPHTINWGSLTQYYLKIISVRGTQSGQGWYDGGTDATFSISATVSAGEGSQYVLSGWTGSGTGSYTGGSNPAAVTMNNAISDSWENVQKFLNEFQDTVIKGNKMRL